MYYEAKVLFVLYLWHPKTQGAVYLYNTLLQPFLSQNEAAIDQCIEELKTAFFDYTASYFQKCAILHSMLCLTALPHKSPVLGGSAIHPPPQGAELSALAAGLSTSCRPMPIMPLSACNSFRPR